MARPRKKTNTGTPQKPQAAPQAIEPHGVRQTDKDAAATERERVKAARRGAGGPADEDDTTAAPPERERIARRAYELYLARGGAEGDPMEDWLAAEREFIAASGNRERD